ncbi:MAG TPA: hypothetical protein VIK12_10030 [Pengzhenrongella sp.]
MAARHHDPGNPPDDGDRASDDEIAARWAEIVAELGRIDDGAPVTDTVEPHDPTDTVDPPDRDAGPAVTYPVPPWVDAPGADRKPRELSGRDWEGTDQIDAAEAETDALEHFVPPDPGPVFGGDPLLTMAWLGAAGIPIALLITVIAWRSAPTVLLQAAGITFVFSCMLLVWRLPRHRDESDDDSGAVV